MSRMNTYTAKTVYFNGITYSYSSDGNIMIIINFLLARQFYYDK